MRLLSAISRVRARCGSSRSASVAAALDPSLEYWQLRAHKQSLQDPIQFWGEAAKDVHWMKQCSRVLEMDDPRLPTRWSWFPDGTLNTCYNAVDVHVEQGRGDQIAIIHDSPVTNSVTRVTYSELKEQVERCAGVLRNLGVQKGDRVLVYMPMVVEAAVGMLACARIGAIHTVVFGGFAAPELATRIADIQPKVILSASCGLEGQRVIAYKPLLDQAIELTPVDKRPSHCVIVQRPQHECELIPGRDLDWREALRGVQPGRQDCEEVAATDPLYVLHTSGTTGQPKGVVRDNGGHLVALKWAMKHKYGVNPGSVFWAASDVGWVVGHSFIVYAPLFVGATSVMFEGKPVGTPDAGAYWRVLAQHGVESFFTAPTAMRAIRASDPTGELAKQYDLSKLKNLFLAGERSDLATLEWTAQQVNVPVVDHWWQTETGWPVLGRCAESSSQNLATLPVKYGSAAKPMPGYDVHILCPERGVPHDDAHQEGEIAIKLPLPPGTLTTLWQNEERFQDSYLSTFPGYYRAGDSGYKDEDGYFYIQSRVDDVINVAAHRLTTGVMEEALSSHPAVAECCVVGRADELKGQVPVGLVVLNSSHQDASHDRIQRETVDIIRQQIGAIASYKRTVVVKRLPKTRSGKVLRNSIRDILDGKFSKVPATIDDPVILEEIAAAFGLRSLGVGVGVESPA